MCVECGGRAVSSVREPVRRVQVWFGSGAGGMSLEYAATASEARHFYAAMIRFGYRVLIDGRLRRELRPLPCRGLWRYD